MTVEERGAVSSLAVVPLVASVLSPFSVEVEVSTRGEQMGSSTVSEVLASFKQSTDLAL